MTEKSDIMENGLLETRDTEMSEHRDATSFKMNMECDNEDRETDSTYY